MLNNPSTAINFAATMMAEPSDSATILPPEAPILVSQHEEYQYLDLIREILDNGEHRPDR